MPSVFDKFTNQYSLSKTLRFELIPTPKTTQMLIAADVFETDRKIQVKYQKTKRFFDALHRVFITESLQKTTLNYEHYHDAFIAWKKDKISKK